MNRQKGGCTYTGNIGIISIVHNGSDFDIRTVVRDESGFNLHLMDKP